MSKQERYDELDNFLSTLRLLRSELTSKDLIDEINYILYETDYEREKDELENILSNDDELNEREKEYRKMQGF